MATAEKTLSHWQGILAIIVLFVTGGATYGVLSNRVTNLEERNAYQDAKIEKILNEMVNKSDFLEIKQDVKEIRNLLLSKK